MLEYYLNQEQAIMIQYKLNKRLIEILLHMNLMLIETKHYPLMKT